ncbi:MAG: DUF3131 domain-containing protein [Gemmatimonadaceae bacterium]|nr:DUF3131 domain-containing protein [Gemmatimonadaceae bacterium]
MPGFRFRRVPRRTAASEDVLAGPIRGELLGAEHLGERARELAGGQQLAPARIESRTPLLTRLADTRRILEVGYTTLLAHSDHMADVGPAGDWLLDNYHVIQEHIDEVRESLPRRYYRELPELATGPLAGYPRVYELAIALISHSEGRIDSDNVGGFIAAFQEVSTLSLGELWAVPAMLRLGLIENVRRMTLRTTQRLAEIESADVAAARITAAAVMGRATLEVELERFTNDPPNLTDTFVARFLHQLRVEGGALPAVVRLQHWIAEEALSAEEATARATRRLALTQVVMANSITSLRAVGRLDWRTIVEEQSRVEAILREDPLGSYGRMTFSTRDEYRHAVERIAKHTGWLEEAVARQVVDMACLALYHDPSDHRRVHVGYYLVDDGLMELERITGCRNTRHEAVLRWIHRHPSVVFVGGVISTTIAALAMVLWLAGPSARAVWPAVLLLGLLPASDIAVSVVNRLITTFLPPRRLPKLDLVEHGVPAEYRTAVVIPTLFDTVESVHDTLGNLEVQYLANRQPHLHFAVLSDFTDASTESAPGDDAILDAAVQGVHALNARYAPETQDAFHLFHRPRQWNAQEGVWMGWERKRGKLGEFNRYVLSGTRDGFSAIVGNSKVMRSVRYVITLDADTALPSDAAPLLVGAIAHPLNRAVYDPALGRVVRGHGILQPRVGISLPSAHGSRFATIHSGEPGVDPYTTAVSDVYQDLYGEGSFTGKGVYDVEMFERATHGRFPENTLLSHDLIEGSYARAGLVTDIMVYDDYPSRYAPYARRKHRWIRGDWQLLPWLAGTVPGPNGPERNRLSILSRWKILDNLRRSLVEIGQIVFLVGGWLFLPVPLLRWTLLGMAAVAAPWIVSLLLTMVRPPPGKSWRAYYAAAGRDALTSAHQVALTLAVLPDQAWRSADAIARTLWRIAVSRRHLLEWQSASHSERRGTESVAAGWRSMGFATAVGAALLLLFMISLVDRRVAMGAAPTVVLMILAGPMVLGWMLLPMITPYLDRPVPQRDRRLSPEDITQVFRYARLHWQFFDRFVTAETHWLAPDNFQEDPEPVVAMRTSPTNIGLQLLAVVSARDLGLITLADMVERLERTMSTLTKLRRYRGHYCNWYSLHDLSVLEPAYVSTVDSGNLAGHLLALRQACLETAREVNVDPPVIDRLKAIGDQAYADVMAMDFEFLLDPQQQLFSIGVAENSGALDLAHYDLLASEARLASFLAIAKHDAPTEHWFRLGRRLTWTAGAPALASWSGSMFEYLMPLLVMRALPSTVLTQTYEGALTRQIADGTTRGVPWGMSESAYNVRDRHRTYQYRPFGVPDLALKRGMGRELVIAPYASALAVMVDPAKALANLARLESIGALGEFGFRDAVDFTRPDAGHRYAIVGNYMAHHIGMSLVALTNAVTGNVWQRRFHDDPLVRSAELLLHERIPREVILQSPRGAQPDDGLPEPDLDRPVVREFDTPHTPTPHVAFLGHQPYTVMLTSGGAGYSRYESWAVNRWKADGTRDAWGQFCYVKDITTGRVWSTAHQPVCAPADRWHVALATDRVTFDRTDGDIATRTEIAVVPEDSAEVRRITLTNNGRFPREIELTSYGEIVLATADADRAHPAFSNLFVETAWHEWANAITATRRPRSAMEKPLWFVHVVDWGKDRSGPISCETDRARFLGRGRSTRDPVALEADGPLSGTTGAVLDPIFAVRTRVRLAAGQSASVAFTSLVATTPERAFTLADRYRDSHAAQRALDLAWISSQVELRELELTPADAAVCHELAGHLLYGNAALRAAQSEQRRNLGSQPLLWSVGVSGDLPIVLATIDTAEGLPTLRQLLAAHRFLHRRGVLIDLVILDEHTPTYLQDLGDRIAAAAHAVNDSGLLEKPGGVFVRRRDLLNAEARLMLRATARLHLPCDGRALSRILSTTIAAAALPPQVTLPSWSRIAPPQPIAEEPGLTESGFANGIGDLTESGAYVMSVRGDTVPPAPWANVIANEHGGFLVTERGGGFAWAGNSYFYRLTPWHNDPVADPISDVVYLQDETTNDTDNVWCVTPAPIRTPAAYRVQHDTGSTSFEHLHAGIATRYQLGMADDSAVKLGVLRVTNTTNAPRRIIVTTYVEWVLGVLREHTQHQVHTTFDRDHGAILARNTFDPQFADWTAFHAISERVTEHTGSRREFLGRNGTTAAPEGLRSGAVLSGSTGAGIDPCAALRCVLELNPGETREVTIVLGAAPNDAAARTLIARYGESSLAREALDRSIAGWRQRLDVVTVRTPVPTFDAMLNRWSLYQALGCRMWARSALYQSSGAFGFRDQLQDVMAFVYTAPWLAREHILQAAARQFVEGDVQHWWHPQSGRGVRTRFSDDLVWLPYVVDQYVRTTGDTTVLDEHVPFLQMRPLQPDEHEIYDLPDITEAESSVYEHCRLALFLACTTGAHGLPLIGGGDWNDGMNRVGVEGRGESVWLAWFLITTLRAFALHADARNDAAVAKECRDRADQYAVAVEKHGWDGAWYRRAYFDDGTPLGSSANEECRIDSIAQSWSVISGAGSPERQVMAMQSFEEHLVKDEECLVLLLTPPFNTSPKDPGYIKGYLPGVRENGAQYTHAALWAVLATALQGRSERAFELFQMVNPLTHTQTPAGVATYKVEPYVVAADVYTAVGQVGRGGWTWYTGSASWMYRVGLEGILGFEKRGDTLVIAPRAPASWAEYTIKYRHGRSVYEIVVRNIGGKSRGVGRVTIDGRAIEGNAIPLVDDGQSHHVEVRHDSE